MHDSASSALHVLVDQKGTPIVFKYNPAFDSSSDLVSALELPRSQAIADATIAQGFISVQEIDSSNDFISVCVDMGSESGTYLNIF